MEKVLEPTLNQIFGALEHQILFGKTHLAISKGLTKAEPKVYGVAPTFFGLTEVGGIHLAQITIARLYDRTPKTVTVFAMLCRAFEERADFSCGDEAVVTEAILDCLQRVIGLQSIRVSIRTNRNKWLGHLDAATVRDPQALAKKVGLTIVDLDRAFEETEAILNKITRLFDGSHGPIRFLGGDDYEGVFEHIRLSQDVEKKELDATFEAEFGHPPPPPARLVDD